MGAGSDLAMAAITRSSDAPGEQQAHRRRERAAADHAERVRLGEQVRDRLGLQPGRPPRPPPDQRLRRPPSASTPRPGGRSASMASSSRRSSGAAVENSESDSAA